MLIDQPIMRDVLADLAIEAEASLALTLRMARALDHRGDAHEDALVRLGAALGKYWICKRAPLHAYEAMECIGGSGVMEDSPMPRLYREGPVNAIWEGSGNVQCLDVLRAIQQHAGDARRPISAEVARRARRAIARSTRHVAALKEDLRDTNDFEARARDLCDRLALGLAGERVVRSAPGAICGRVLPRAARERAARTTMARCRAEVDASGDRAARGGEVTMGKVWIEAALNGPWGRFAATRHSRRRRRDRRARGRVRPRRGLHHPRPRL